MPDPSMPDPSVLATVVIAAGGSGRVLVELGVVLLVLAVLGRLAARADLPSIPLYLLAGLLLGQGSLFPLDASAEFIRVGADVGVVLLLLLLGLEFEPEELRDGLRANWPAGALDLVANFVPGWLLGLALGWSATSALLLGGITYISSSGIIAKLLGDLDRLGNRETPVVLSVLVIEDIVMAVFLPLSGVLLVGASFTEGAVSIAIALAVVVVAFIVALRWSGSLSRLLDTRSAELLLLTVLGLTLFVAGLAAEVQVSAAVGAFLLGVMLSGQIAERGRALLEPIRDVFGGLFFVFFGLQIDPAALGPVLLPALGLAAVTAATKVGTGWWAARRAGIGRAGRVRAGVALVPRGEFSIVIAGLGVAAGIEDDLGPLAACYVLILAVAGSLAMRYVDGSSAGHRPSRRASPAAG
jgi:CPA2 family monovalent cation:H+ antiporter-2